MNKTLRQAIYKKKMQYYNKFLKHRYTKNWENYRQQRNLVTKISKEIGAKLFFERFIGGPKSTDFWPTIKRFMCNK